MPSAVRVCTFTFVAVFVLAASVRAQDLFELEVLDRVMASPGETSMDLHANGIPGDPDRRIAPDHPLHTSVEISFGWTHYFETGVFLEMAPLVPLNGHRFGGGHIRPKFKLPS